MIDKELTFHDQKIPYALKKSRRARRMRLTVHCDGSVILTTPIGTDESFAERFIRDKAEWLLSKISFFDRHPPGPLARLTRADYAKNKGAALILANRTIAELNAVYKYDFNAVSVKNQKTCWGSCSRKRNLNFNYKLVFLPENVQRYVVAHELCHLEEFNHSKKFWELVAKTVQDHREARKELRQNGLSHY
jgi:predicted metal-dependent hydrolase